jgi:hypothetical protein
MGSEWGETVALILAWANERLSSWQSGGCETQETNDPDPDPYLVYASPLGSGTVTQLDIARVSINAALGSYETVSHILHFRPKGGFSGPNDATEMVLLAGKVRDQWATFFGTTDNYASNTAATKYMFRDDLHYTDVIASWIGYDSEDIAHPVVHVGGQKVTFPASGAGSAVGTGGGSLPNEVACCLTLRTDQAGPTTRGRLYLGGLAAAWMSSSGDKGMFFDQYYKAVGHCFGASFVDAIHNDSTVHHEVNVLSRKNATSRGVGGVSVGQVPDSQRRRRFSQPENKTLVWGS